MNAPIRPTPLCCMLIASGLMATVASAWSQETSATAADQTAAAPQAATQAQSDGAAQPDIAQADAKAKAAQLPTIFVTAQKRTQSLKEVPISVGVVSKEELERRGVKGLGDLANADASLEFGDMQQGGAGGSASIRGIGTAVFAPTAESSVGIVVDGVPLGITAGGALFDIDHVEVLRGPQGMLFGKNASAGVVNIVTVDPDTKRLSGYVSTELAGRDVAGSQLGDVVLRGAINVPINDISAVRITAHSDELTGVYHNTLTGQYEKSDGQGFRAKYLLRPSNDLTISVIGEYDETRVTGPSFYAPAVGSAATVASFASCGVTVSPRNNQVCSDGIDDQRERNSGMSLQVTKDFGSTAFTSVTALRLREQGPGYWDVDMSNAYNSVQTDRVGANHQFSQEFRLASVGKQDVEWVVGAYYARAPGNRRIDLTLLTDPALAGMSPSKITQLMLDNTKSTTEAVFGQATFRLTDKLSAITGLRYTHDSVSAHSDMTQTLYDAPQAPPVLPFEAVVDAGSNQSNVSGRVGLQYAVDKTTNVYTTLSRGYKGPQIDNNTVEINLLNTAPPFTTATGAGNVIKPEVPTSLDMGVKSDLFNRRLGLDLSAFYTKLKNFQEQTCSQTPVGALNCVPLNVPTVNNYGVEIDLRARPIPDLTLTSSTAVTLGTVYPSGFQFDSQNVGGQRLLYSAKVKTTLSAEYEIGSVNDYPVTIGADATYKSRVRYCNSLDSACAFGGHTIVDLQAGFRSPDDKWGVGMFARNIGDMRVPSAITYPLAGKPAGSGYANEYGINSFRTVGLRADVHF